MTDLKQVLASNMRLYRKNLGISQAKLAELANITDNYIALIETGKRFPSVNMMERIAKALGKDTLDLFLINKIRHSGKKNLKTVILKDIEVILTNRLEEDE